jgi:hypothetical protein
MSGGKIYVGFLVMTIVSASSSVIPHLSRWVMGRSLFFWYDCWLGEGVISCDKYDHLYNLSVSKFQLVYESGRWMDGRWVRVWNWRRDLNA